MLNFSKFLIENDNAQKYWTKISNIFGHPNLTEIQKEVLNDEEEGDNISKIQIGLINDLKIFLVNGNEIKEKFWMDFVEGGNDMVYGVNSAHAFKKAKFIPDNEIWIDASVDLNQSKYICLHEVIERNLMKHKNMKYEDAHNIADKIEKEKRVQNDPLQRDQVE
jgi:hypothetical protein